MTKNREVSMAVVVWGKRVLRVHIVSPSPGNQCRLTARTGPSQWRGWLGENQEAIEWSEDLPAPHAER